MPLICLVACCFASPLIADELDAGSIEFFEAKVCPLLVSHCCECHSEEAAKAEKLKGGLRLDIRAGVHAVGDSGPVIEPGKPDESPLIRSVRYTDENLQMPPKERLSAEQVAVLEEWVRCLSASPASSSGSSDSPHAAVPVAGGEEAYRAWRRRPCDWNWWNAESRFGWPASAGRNSLACASCLYSWHFSKSGAVQLQRTQERHPCSGVAIV